MIGRVIDLLLLLAITAGIVLVTFLVVRLMVRAVCSAGLLSPPCVPL